MSKWDRRSLAEAAAKVFFTVGPAAGAAGWAHALDPNNVFGAAAMGGIIFAISYVGVNTKRPHKVPILPDSVKEIFADEEKNKQLRDFFSSRTAYNLGLSDDPPPDSIDIPHNGDIVRVREQKSIQVQGPAARHDIK